MASEVAIEPQASVRNAVCSVLDIPTSSLNPSATFTSLGGDSLAAIAVSNRCRRDNVFLPVSAILCENAISKLAPSAVTRHLKKRKASEVSDQDQPYKYARLEADCTSAQCLCAPISAPANRARISSLTEMQSTLIDGSHVKSGTNIISFRETYRTHDLERMRHGWQVAIDAEPIFRLCSTSQDIRQSAEGAEAEPFDWIETVVESEEEYQRELDALPTTSDLRAWFNVVTLIRPEPLQGISTIIWRVHHALIDGWSARLVYQNARRAAEGKAIRPGISFEGVAERIEALGQASETELRQFWTQQHTDVPHACGQLDFEGSESQPTVESASRTQSSQNVDCDLDLELDEITGWCQAHSVTTAALYSAAWALVMSLYTNSDAVVFGVVVPGRSLPLEAVEEVVGPLVNTLPLYVRVSENTPSLDFIRYILDKTASLEAVSYSKPDHGFQRNFCSAISRDMEFAGPGDATIRPIGPNSFSISSDIPIAIAVQPNGGLRLTYSNGRYNERQMSALISHYESAVHALLVPSSSVVSCIQNILSGKTLQHLLQLGNCLSQDTSPGASSEDLVTLFEKAASSEPSAVAVEKGQQCLTYADLDQYASYVAATLSKLIKPGECVCVHADRSINWIVAIYGVLKAGGVYAPLDPALPAHIRQKNTQTVACNVFLVPSTADLTVGGDLSCTSLSIESIVKSSSFSARSWPHRAHSNPSADAYVCFTSGSTGVPRAVLCSHEGLVAFQRDEEVRLRTRPGIKVSQIMSPAFDGSIHELFSTFSYGATIVLPIPTRPLEHLKRVDSAILIPSVAAVLDPQEYPRLRNVYFVGEAVPEALKDVWSSHKDLFNMYGPTEATCGSTIKRLVPLEPVTIGAPNPSTRVYILDRNQRLLPRGVAGEIYLAGIQVARRYVGNATQTAERFFPDHICKRNGERMYRTGDHGFWTERGEIVYLGRKDRQIKLRGHRVDLEDVEARIGAAVPEAKNVAVALHKDSDSDDSWLGTMLQPRVELTAEKAKQQIAQTLPAYMCPRQVLVREEVPLTSVGKLDYKGVEKELAAAAEASNSLPTQPTWKHTRTEDIIERTWREILQLPITHLINPHASFAGLGADSLQHLALCDALSRELGANIPLKLIWDANDLTSFASTLDEHLSHSPSPISKEAVVASSSPLGPQLPSPIEIEWWNQYQGSPGDPGTAAFNVSVVWQIDARVDRLRLAEAWNNVLARHRVLSSRFTKACDGPRRVYGPAPKARLHESEAELNTQAFVDEPFDLNDVRAPLARVAISPSVLVVSISHILADLTTLRVLLGEVRALYAGEELPPPHFEYEQTCWPASQPASLLDFWPSYLRPALTDRAIRPALPPRRSFQGQSRMLRLPTNLAARIRNFVTTSDFTLHQLSLGAVALAIHSTLMPGTGPLILGTPYFNRNPDHLRTVGLFLEPLPVVVHPEPPNATSHQPFLESVRASSRAALEHVVPWHQLQTVIAGESRTAEQQSRSGELFDAMVTAHDDAGTDGDALGIEGCHPTVCWSTGAKFPLMCEFSAVGKGGLLLRLEWDNELYGWDRVDGFVGAVVEALGDCVGGEQVEKRDEEITAQEVRWGTLVSEVR